MGVGSMEKIKEIGLALKKAREGKGYTVRSFATEVGLSPTTITRIENGIHSPGLKVLISISEKLGMEVKIEKAIV